MKWRNTKAPSAAFFRETMIFSFVLCRMVHVQNPFDAIREHLSQVSLNKIVSRVLERHDRRSHFMNSGNGPTVDPAVDQTKRGKFLYLGFLEIIGGKWGEVICLSPPNL